MNEEMTTPRIIRTIVPHNLTDKYQARLKLMRILSVALLTESWSFVRPIKLRAIPLVHWLRDCPKFLTEFVQDCIHIASISLPCQNESTYNVSMTFLMQTAILHSWPYL